MKFKTVPLCGLVIFFCLNVAVLTQPQGESSVRFTKVRTYRVSPTVLLPGTVVSSLRSTVASEVSGLVEDFPVREGQFVKEGEILARLRRENLELRLQEARAQLKEDEARRDLAEKTMQRTQDLLAKGAVSQQDVDDRESEFNSLERRIDRLRAVIDQLTDDLERTVIRAPFSGTVVEENTQLGEWINVGGSVVDLMSMEKLEVKIDLPEKYYRFINLGTRAVASFEALEEVRVIGRVSVIIPLADPQARTFPVKLEISNPGNRIAVGMLAQVELSVGNQYQANIVPKDAVIMQGPKRVTYLITEAETVQQLEIETGNAVGNWIEVAGPLKPGDRVITRGNERLQDGMKVRAIPEEIEYELP